MITRAGIDSTDLRRVKQQGRTHRTLLESLSETSGEGILVVSTDDQILLCNGRFLELWGIPGEADAPRTYKDLLQRVREKVRTPADFEQLIESGERHHEPTRQEVRLIDGRVLERCTAPIHDEQDKVYARAWFIYDVTERKELEELAGVAAQAQCILWHAEIRGEDAWERDVECQGYRFRGKIRF